MFMKPWDRALRAALFGLSLLAVFCGSTFAEIPIKTQRSMQEAAPEKLQISVQDVKQTEVRGYFRLVVTAKVTAVEASATGLKKGDIVTIRYSHPNFKKVRAVGSWASPVAKGKNYKAYLKVKDNQEKLYEPAALSGTFETVE